MAPPLISPYKQRFVLKRLVETFTDLKLFSPISFIIIQLILFSLPSIFVSSISQHTRFNEFSLEWKCFIIGCGCFLIDTSLALIILLLKRGKHIIQILPSVKVSDIDGENGEEHDTVRENTTTFLAQEDMVKSLIHY